jgi:hypothetical protein
MKTTVFSLHLYIHQHLALYDPTKIYIKKKENKHENRLFLLNHDYNKIPPMFYFLIHQSQIQYLKKEKIIPKYNCENKQLFHIGFKEVEIISVVTYEP